MGQFDFNYGWNVADRFDEDRKERGNDPPTYASNDAFAENQCLGRCECPTCRRFFGYCSDVALHLKKIDHQQRQIETLKQLIRDYGNEDRVPMDLKGHRSPERKGGRGKGQKGTGKGGKFPPFLKAKDIPAKGLKLKLSDFRTAPKNMEFSDFLILGRNGTKEFTIGLRSQTVLLDMLMDELGSKTEKWENKSVTFVRGGQKGQYINVG